MTPGCLPHLGICRLCDLIHPFMTPTKMQLFLTCLESALSASLYFPSLRLLLGGAPPRKKQKVNKLKTNKPRKKKRKILKNAILEFNTVIKGLYNYRNTCYFNAAIQALRCFNLQNVEQPTISKFLKDLHSKTKVLMFVEFWGVIPFAETMRE